MEEIQKTIDLIAYGPSNRSRSGIQYPPLPKTVPPTMTAIGSQSSTSFIRSLVESSHSPTVSVSSRIITSPIRQLMEQSVTSPTTSGLTIPNSLGDPPENKPVTKDAYDLGKSDISEPRPTATGHSSHKEVVETRTLAQFPVAARHNTGFYEPRAFLSTLIRP